MMIKWKKILKRNFDLSTWLEFDEVFFSIRMRHQQSTRDTNKTKRRRRGSFIKVF